MWLAAHALLLAGLAAAGGFLFAMLSGPGPRQRLVERWRRRLGRSRLAVGSAAVASVAGDLAAADSAAVVAALAAAAPAAAGRRGGMKLSRLVRHIAHHALEHAPVLLRRRSAMPSSRQSGSARRSHSGEIRFVVETAFDLPELWRGLPARQRALQVFGQFGVWDTAHNNGVLIYVLMADHAVEIIADRGIAGARGASRVAGGVPADGAALPRSGAFARAPSPASKASGRSSDGISRASSPATTSCRTSPCCCSGSPTSVAGRDISHNSAPMMTRRFVAALAAVVVLGAGGCSLFDAVPPQAAAATPASSPRRRRHRCRCRSPPSASSSPRATT